MRSISLTYKQLSQAIILIVVATAFFSCAKDDFDFIDPQPQATSGLLITPQIYDQLATRAPSNYYEEETGWERGQTKPADDALMENDLGTHLDVFISGIDDDYWKEFHLIQGETFAGGLKANVKDQVADLLTDAWKTMGSEGNPNLKLTLSHRYDVYVAVNNTATNAHIGSKSALLSLTNHNANVYKLYGNQGNEYDQSRRMLMDGHVVWTLENDDQLQRIEVPLKRAEAKIVAKIQFDPAFYASLIDNNYVSSPIGNPAWKWTNWCFDSKVFADGPDITPTLQTNTGRNNAILTGTLKDQKYYHYEGRDALGQNVDVYFTEDEKDTEGNRYLELYPSAEERYVDGVPYCYIVTYDYCNTWGENAEELAPYMLVSYPFYSKESAESANTITTFNYYRIPLCDESTHAGLERNHIYKVEATISGSGSTSLSGRVNDVRLNYQVVDWTNDENDIVNILAEKFYYFYVTPKRYELRGNDTQTVDLAYYAPEGSVVQVRNVKIYYYNSSGTTVYQYGSNNTQLNAEHTTFTTPNTVAQPTSITVNADGTIHISSEALANKAVKYISFTAFTTFVDENGRTQTLTENVFIKHFPTDNIQNVEGWWSSGADGSTVDITSTEIRYNQGGDGWTAGTTEFTTNQPNNYTQNGWLRQNGYYRRNLGNGQYAYSLTQQAGYNRQNGYIYYRTPYTKNVTNSYSWVRWGENSNDYRVAHEGILQSKVFYNGQIYFIMDSDCLPTQSQIYGFDKYNRSNGYYNYRDDYYSRDGFWHFHTYKRDNSLSNNYLSPYATLNTNNGNYILNPPGWDMYNNYYNDTYYEEGYDNKGFVKKPATGAQYGLTNNHMYVIQISSTSDEYILGRPEVNETTHQSDDHVVSPAFMIASQLGALSKGSTYDPAEAAAHCARYMEVATDGTRYTGWRLPTKEEISIIINYQEAIPETMATVLSDCNYYALNGEGVWTGLWADTNENRNRIPFIRCVRDLSPEEIEAINSKE